MLSTTHLVLPDWEGIHTDKARASQRASVCNREGKDDAQPGGHAEKGGAEAAERPRKTASTGERNRSKVLIRQVEED